MNQTLYLIVFSIWLSGALIFTIKIIGCKALVENGETFVPVEEEDQNDDN